MEGRLDCKGLKVESWVQYGMGNAMEEDGAIM